jgi:nitrogenase-associated protein
MAVVTFYEKPGCSGNAKQKKILEAAGHTVVPRDLFKTPWTDDGLRAFFGALPVVEWFNANSAGVKSGEIVPADYDEAAALALLKKHPLLIRRPLLEVDGVRKVGFDVAAIDAWIGLGADLPDEDMEACQHGQEGHVCQGHAHDHPCGHDHDHGHESDKLRGC